MPPIEVSWDTLDLFKKCLTDFNIIYSLLYELKALEQAIQTI